MVSTVLAISVLALLLDRCLGEPRRWHPLVGFGALADRLEHRLNRGGARRWRGILAWLLLLLPAVVATAVFQTMLRDYSPLWFGIVAVFIVYLAIGRQSLVEHARAVA